MRNHGRISSWQYFTMMMGYFIGTFTLMMPVGPAQEDGWISILIAGFLSLGTVLIWNRLASHIPDKTPFQYSKQIFGETLGTVVNLIYSIYFLHLGALVIRNISELYLIAIMPNTPLVIFSSIMGLLAVRAVRLGIEVIARIGESIFPFLVVLTLLLTILVFCTPELVQIKRILPIMEAGLSPILKGALLYLAFPFGEGVTFLFLWPFVNKSRLKPWVFAIVFSALLLAIIYVRDISVFGATEGARMNFLDLSVIQEIKLGEFLQRIDAVVIFIWTFGTFVKLIICYYVACQGLSETFALKDYKPVTLPLGLIMVTFSILQYNNIYELINFFSRWYPFYAIPMQIILPVIALITIQFR